MDGLVNMGRRVVEKPSIKNDFFPVCDFCWQFGRSGAGQQLVTRYFYRRCRADDGGGGG